MLTMLLCYFIMIRLTKSYGQAICVVALFLALKSFYLGPNLAATKRIQSKKVYNLEKGDDLKYSH